jgi:hypothetical protein
VVAQFDLPLPLPKGFGFCWEEVRLAALLSVAGLHRVDDGQRLRHGVARGAAHVLAVVRRAVFCTGPDPGPTVEGEEPRVDRCRVRRQRRQGPARFFDALRSVNPYDPGYLLPEASGVSGSRPPRPGRQAQRGRHL